ncbi:transitional endoplasmic reticulum ATPase C [Guillardia theta CCMP2712]|uniref:Transitional endoplasmic reticulum ATPase C n=1 Tax=Guillardia theta (strain CCMP2712) TaxID=905079 RepID=L1JP69_GUITC|nr:transitional endoplasmic reticulum ATPase C [Guillardia theta CCMP2712]EKX50084.1 transitional endoplasmic reticulum ATPase C [Guillardia theta CCMP2712]|eukprot:XP_005837064.1 transitional endoplasmic reticulum ATPase C [Guillardia theta CCMP2712]
MVRIGRPQASSAEKSKRTSDFVAFNNQVLLRMTALVKAGVHQTHPGDGMVKSEQGDEKHLIAPQGLEAPYCVLLEGPPGVGKTSLIRHVAQSLAVNVISFQEEWTCLSHQQTEHEFIPPNYDHAFARCLKKADNLFPAVIHVEQAHCLLGPHKLSTDFSSSGRDDLFLLTLRKYLQEKGSATRGCLLVLESQSTKMIDSNILTKIPDHVHFPQLGIKERLTLTSIDLELINSEMMGFSAAEVSDCFFLNLPSTTLPCTALTRMTDSYLTGGQVRDDSAMSIEDFMKAIREIRPRSAGRVEEVPLHNVKLEDAGLAFIAADVAQLVKSGIGESERQLVEMFQVPLCSVKHTQSEREQRACEAAPCMLFLDELQAAFARPDNEENDGTGSRQLASQLKLEMDALQAKPEVYVMGATNAVHMLDPDLLRPGRFDHVIQVKLPDLEARRTILTGMLRHLPVSFDPDGSGPRDKLSLAELLSVATAGCSGADLRHLCQLAGLRSIAENRYQPTCQDFVASLAKVTSCTQHD